MCDGLVYGFIYKRVLNGYASAIRIACGVSKRGYRRHKHLWPSKSFSVLCRVSAFEGCVMLAYADTPGFKRRLLLELEPNG